VVSEATLGFTRKLYVWDMASGALRTLEDQEGSVTAIAFSRDGSYLVSGSIEGELRLWDVASGASRALALANPFETRAGKLFTSDREVYAVACSPDGRHVISGFADATLRLWEVASGTSRAFEGHGDAVHAVAFSPDGRHVASGSADGTLRLWEVASGTSRLLDGHGDKVRAVAVSPDGRHVVSGSDDRTLRLWEVATGNEVARLDGDFRFRALQLAPDGKSLVAADSGGRVQLLDVLVDTADKAAWLARYSR
jgi:WD40 repeat protein